MEKRIRVLHILDELNTGGAEKIVVSYFQHIDRSKFQWDFVITRYADPNKRGLLEDTVEKLGGHIYRVHRKRENYRANIKDVDEIIKNGHYDIVHSHLDELSTFYLLSAKRYGVPVRICHSHLAGASRGRAVEALCKILKPILNKTVTDRFACGTDAAIALWGKKAVEQNRVYIMRNAIETDQFAFDPEVRQSMRSSFGITNEIVLGTVGRLSYQKNSEFNIEIFNAYHKLNPKSILLIIGEGELKNEMEKLSEAYGIEDSIKFLGRRNDVNKLMMAMDAFLLPSRYEGLPIVLVEAQCCGLNCLVANNVTKEIKLSEDVVYLPLESGPRIWAKNLLGMVSNDRTIGKKEVEQAGYKLENCADKVQEYYIKRLRR